MGSGPDSRCYEDTHSWDVYYLGDLLEKERQEKERRLGARNGKKTSKPVEPELTSAGNATLPVAPKQVIEAPKQGTEAPKREVSAGYVLLRLGAFLGVLGLIWYGSY